jgi:hypothetical protein
LIDCDKITSVGITTAVEAESENQKAMFKTARQKRRFQLSNPATISSRLTAILADRFSPEVIADKIDMLFSATITDKAGNERPDIRAIEAGLRFALNYTAGTPVQRQEVITHSPDDSMPKDDVQELINGSPALRKELAHMIGMGERDGRS